MKELKIISNGTHANTQVMYGDEKVPLVQRVEFEAVAGECCGKVGIYFAKGHLDLSVKGKEQVELMIADGWNVVEMADLVKENRILEKQIVVMKQRIKELEDGMASLDIENPDIKTEGER